MSVNPIILMNPIILITPSVNPIILMTPSSTKTRAKAKVSIPLIEKWWTESSFG
jgi:hypothetical protein